MPSWKAASPCRATAWSNYPAFFKELPGYSGWLVVEAEQDPEKANPLKYATMGCANLKRYAKDAKLA